MKIALNTTIVDVSFNLSGSLAGIPALLQQLPAGVRLGFTNFPAPTSDPSDIGQTWTPNLAGRELALSVPIYNPKAQAKAPYSTDLYGLSDVIQYGNDTLRTLINSGIL